VSFRGRRPLRAEFSGMTLKVLSFRGRRPLRAEFSGMTLKVLSFRGRRAAAEHGIQAAVMYAPSPKYLA